MKPARAQRLEGIRPRKHIPDNPPPQQSSSDWPQGSGGTSTAAGHLEYLSQSAMEFVRLPPQADLYRQIATRIHSLLGDAIVAVTSYDSETRELCQRAVAGSGKIIEAASAIAGTRLMGFRRILDAATEREIRTGRLLRIKGGLYDALLGAVPRKVTRTIERLMGVRSVYGMGCLVNDECFGGVLMLLRADDNLPPAEVVEAFISQAALAMQKRNAEDALRRNEERLRTLMEKATDAYLVMTTDGVVRDVNRGAIKAMGYTRAEVLGRPIGDFMDPNEMLGKPPQWDRLKKGESFNETRRLRRADGSYAVFDAHITPLSDGQVLVVARDITDRRRLEMEVAEASRREREAIGRDLHDSLGQQLSGIAFLCAALSKDLAERGVPEAAEADRITRLLGESVGQTRRIAQGLCLVNLAPCGVFSALAGLADHASSVYGVDCRFSPRGEDVVPRDATASNLYLIAQEATANAVRHGRAQTIEIELRTHRSHGLLLIRDNGRGFPPSPNPASGMGLRIMKYRAEMIDGLLDVASGPSGTTVKCSFPCPDPGED